jgi:hypothetical protein
MATKRTRTGGKKSTSSRSARGGERQERMSRKKDRESSSSGRDEKLIGSERFPRKGDDEQSS